MKPIVCFILLSFNLAIILPQNASRFPIREDGIWYMKYNDVYQDVFEYFIDSDTTINNSKYFKIYKTGTAYYDTAFYYEHIYVGAIRDDDDKLYYIDKGETTESNLFDFNISIGDTIKSEIAKGVVINSIDTLPDGRKVFNYEIPCMIECPVIKIIEGIGHAGGIMKDPPNFHAGFAGYNLICYLENVSLIYHNDFGFEDDRCDAQNSSRFPIKPTSEWKINFDEISAIPNWTGGEEEFRLFVDKDTLINALSYYKLYKSGIAHYDTIFSFDHVYVGAIRDENNKFYFIEKNTTNEIILYDFDLTEDDTIYTDVEHNMAITSIETLEDGRKKFNINKTDFQHGECSNIFNTYLIEGIGSMGGLFYESPCEHIGFMEHFLLCYYENDSIVYHNSLSPISCDNTSSISPKNTIKINIFPNPASIYITINLSENIDPETTVNIYDMLGRCVMSEKFQLLNNSLKLDISQYYKGLYLFEILNKEYTYTQKVLLH